MNFLQAIDTLRSSTLEQISKDLSMKFHKDKSYKSLLEQVREYASQHPEHFFSQLKITSLKRIARDQKIPGYSKFKKKNIQPLRELICHYQPEPKESRPTIFPRNFDDIPISTKTVVINTNIHIHSDLVFRTLPVHALPDVPLGNKKTIQQYIAKENLPNGTIISMEYEKECRGIPIKHFRNSMTIMMVVDNKTFNYKVPTQGRIQITGCKDDHHAESCIQHLWEYLQQYSTKEAPLYSFRNGDTTFRAMFRLVMTNKNFNLGFHVNREALDYFMNTNPTGGRSLLQDSFGYSGVNIKFPYTYGNIAFTTLRYQDHQWKRELLYYNQYLKTLGPKEYTEEVERTRENSFMIFQSGAVIMSGADTQHMRDTYYHFVMLIQECRPQIEDTV